MQICVILFQAFEIGGMIDDYAGLWNCMEGSGKEIR
jgi:hypothetical protein